MTKIAHFLPSSRHVVVLMPPNGQLIGVISFLEALNTANQVRAHRNETPLYTIRLCGVSQQTTSSAGPVVNTTPAHTIDDLHTLVIGGGMENLNEPIDEQVVQEAGRLARRAARIVSICMGTFVLGALGLLDGRRCTSHWLALDRLRQRYPTANVETDAIFTEDEAIYTSAGATAGIDLALHLIRQDGGRRLALAVARLLVVFAQRPGGQSQFGSAVRLRAGLDDRLRTLVGTVLDNPGADHSVQTMAKQVGMSPRHFARVFREQSGETPAAFVSRARVEVAQRALIYGDDPIDAIAERCGFGSASTMRRTFLRVKGVSPSDYRARFSL